MESGEGPSVGLSPLFYNLRHSVKRSHGQMEELHRRSSSPLFVPQNRSLSREAPRTSPLYRRRGDTPPGPISPRRQRLRLPPPVPSIGHFAPYQNPYGLDRRSVDLRRPISSMNQAHPNVIDLTEPEDASANSHTGMLPSGPSFPRTFSTQPGPNNGRDIFIDLSADTSPPTRRQEEPPFEPNQSSRRLPHTHMASHRTAQPSLRRESSSEVVFVGERPLSQLASRPTTPTAASSHPHRHFQDLTADDDDDLVLVSASERSGVNLPPPIGAGNVRTQPLAAPPMARILAQERALAAGLMHRVGRAFLGADDNYETEFEMIHQHAGGNAHRGRSHRPRHFHAPGLLNYGGVGFELHPTDHRPPTPIYSPPPPPDVGFTRSPAEDETVVCPACGDELATGDTEDKRQVWIVKSCGHVYCGECMQNRTKRGARAKAAGNKGKGRATDPPVPRPFSTCVVDGCGSKVSNKNYVLQIFL